MTAANCSWYWLKLRWGNKRGVYWIIMDERGRYEIQMARCWETYQLMQTHFHTEWAAYTSRLSKLSLISCPHAQLNFRPGNLWLSSLPRLLHLYTAETDLYLHQPLLACQSKTTQSQQEALIESLCSLFAALKCFSFFYVFLHYYYFCIPIAMLGEGRQELLYISCDLEQFHKPSLPYNHSLCLLQVSVQDRRQNALTGGMHWIMGTS